MYTEVIPSLNMYSDFVPCYAEETCSGPSLGVLSERGCCVDSDEGRGFSKDGQCFGCLGMNYHVIAA